MRHERSFHRYRRIAADHCPDPDRTADGGCIDHGAFRTHLALGNDTRSDPVATTCAPSRATATALRSTESPLCAKRASVSVASRDRDTGVRLSFRRPSRLLPGDQRFRLFRCDPSAYQIQRRWIQPAIPRKWRIVGPAPRDLVYGSDRPVSLIAASASRTRFSAQATPSPRFSAWPRLEASSHNYPPTLFNEFFEVSPLGRGEPRFYTANDSNVSLRSRRERRAPPPAVCPSGAARPGSRLAPARPRRPGSGWSFGA